MENYVILLMILFYLVSVVLYTNYIYSKEEE